MVSKILLVDFSAVSGRLKRRNKYHLVKKRTGKNANREKSREL
jgi:hypothetical protein